MNEKLKSYLQEQCDYIANDCAVDPIMLDKLHGIINGYIKIMIDEQEEMFGSNSSKNT